MTDTEKILEFDRIKEKLAELACTEKARQQIQELKPSLSELEVKASQRETTEARKMIEICGNPPVTALQGVDEWIEFASKGGCLTPQQLEQISMVLAAVRRLKDYLRRGKEHEIGLAYYEENLDGLDDIREELGSKIRDERVDDYASKTLKSLREAIDRAETKMHEKADAILKANKQYMADNFSTLRNGRICVPVKKEYKFKIQGSVIDKSSTGSTLFIEPLQVARLYDEVQELKIDEEFFANIVTENKELTEQAKIDLAISMITLKYTQSNSVCFVKDGQAIGIGAGQQSRIHCTRLAGTKADNWWLRQSPQVMNLPFVDGIRRADRDNAIDLYIGDDYMDVLADGAWENIFKEKPEVFTREAKREWLDKLTDVSLGSDAFFPFGDNIERAHRSGVKYVAQPGGSVRDDNVIETCNKYDMVMSFTGLRLFHH